VACGDAWTVATGRRRQLLVDIVAKVAAEQMARKNGQQSNPDEENFEFNIARWRLNLNQCCSAECQKYVCNSICQKRT
jgi:hypothetical protein